MPPLVALHTIGQTPRPDLTPFVVESIGSSNVVITGALDGLNIGDIPKLKPQDYPLETRMNDGARVVVGATFIEGRIQMNVDKEDADATVHLILCAGPFPGLAASSPIVQPFDHAAELFSAHGHSKLLVVVPFQGQAESAAEKWASAGFTADVCSMDERPAETPPADWLVDQVSGLPFDALVLDYVGYPRAVMNRAQEQVVCPVYDLGYLAAQYVRQQIDPDTDGASN